jgi:hypothetical protein
MKGTAGSALVGALSLAASVQASPADIKIKGRDVDTRFPYTVSVEIVDVVTRLSSTSSSSRGLKSTA